MAYTAKWIVKNTVNDLVYLSLSDFWEASTVVESKMAQHSILNEKYVLERGGYLAKDGQSVVHYIVFADEDKFNEWTVERAKLPAIDEDLTWEAIDEIDDELYVTTRGA